MKSALSSSSSSSSSPSRKILVASALATVVLLQLLLPTCATGVGVVTSNSGQQTHRHHSCDAISRSSPKLRSLCIHFQSTQHLPTPPPSPSDYQIDPRYGVEKRRVPSGPNPLHN
ncbi:hypothetical protein RchiOBHm_Chr4g0438701 [Rosa chinensis]|uniref:Uncharacterized protein n=1 Tax=Rosa chinensis TaxID=74649 RepID=A0A2P6R2L2_ROSCH|nr:hypothetical protein RchiOBHm_Chr4g0438701 [Rosa chinensis]